MGSSLVKYPKPNIRSSFSILEYDAIQRLMNLIRANISSEVDI